MEEKDYYELLEISRNASNEVIKNAYRALAKKYHPDTSSKENDFIEKKMHQINEAYEVLSDKEKRMLYDQELKERELSLIQEEKVSTDENISDFEERHKDNVNKKDRKNKMLIIILIVSFFIVAILSFIIVSIVVEPSSFENKKDEQEVFVENVDKIKDKEETDNIKVDNYINEDNDDIELNINSYTDDEIIEENNVDNTEDIEEDVTINDEVEENDDSIIKIY